MAPLSGRVELEERRAQQVEPACAPVAAVTYHQQPHQEHQTSVAAPAVVAIAFVIVNVVIGNVIEPRIMGKGLGLSTFVVFFALIFWGFVLGTVGMFLSVPLTMTMKIILEMNPKTKGIAIFLGSQEEAQAILDNKN